MKNRKGFTLVELLAVIVLLGVLVSIAVPNIVSTINNSKRNNFLGDAKRMVAKAEYLLSIDRDTRKKVQNGTPQVYSFYSNVEKSLNEKNEFPNDPDGGKYDDKSYVKITYNKSGTSGTFEYCVCLVGSKRKIGADGVDVCNSSIPSTCVKSTDLTGVDIVKDK